VAVWNVGCQARIFAFGIVAVATLFVALWVGLGNGLHNNYETPTPVRDIFRFSHCFVHKLIADIAWLVLVLDWS
jgi:hypothetical protein